MMNKEVLINGKKVMCVKLSEIDGHSIPAEPQTNHEMQTWTQESQALQFPNFLQAGTTAAQPGNNMHWPQYHEMPAVGTYTATNLYQEAQKALPFVSYGHPMPVQQSGQIESRTRMIVKKSEIREYNGCWHYLTYTKDGMLINDVLIFMNIGGPCTVYLLKCSKFSKKDELFMLWFSNGIVVGKTKGNLRKNLLSAFIQCGVQMYPIGDDKKLEDALDRYFEPLISNCPNTIAVRERAEWMMTNSQMKFNCTQDPWFPRIQAFADLPISKKIFASESKDCNLSFDYFHIFEQIRNDTVRTLLMIVPIAGVLASWGRCKGLRALILNVVCNPFQDVTWLSEIASVFNRDFNNFVRANLKDKEICQKVYEAHNDVLLVDARSSKSDTPNDIKRKQKNVEKLVSYFGRNMQNEFIDLDIKTDAALLIINDSQIADEAVINIFMEPFIFSKTTTYDVIGTFLTDFVKWAECNANTIDGILNHKDGKISSTIQALFQITAEYWSCNGIDIGKIFPFQQDFSISTENSGNLVGLFIRAIRSNARFYTVTKKYAELLDGLIYLNDNFIIFTSETLIQILKNSGLLTSKNELLNYLATMGMLNCDQEGYTKRRMIEKKRIEVYEIRTNLFQEIGSIDVRALFMRR